MTAPEAAELLKMPVSTVYELARRGELACEQARAHVAIPADAARGPAGRLSRDHRTRRRLGAPQREHRESRGQPAT